MGGKFARWIVAIVVALVLLVGLFNLFLSREAAQSQGFAFSQFLSDVERGEIVKVAFLGNNLIARYKDGTTRSTHAPSDMALARQLIDKGVTVTVTPSDESTPTLLGILVSWLPFLISIWFWWRFVARPLGAVASGVDRIARAMETPPATRAGEGPS